ncbi:MAG: GNAT family N-acetyltransferase [Phycisphaerae bacterium]
MNHELSTSTIIDRYGAAYRLRSAVQKDEPNIRSLVFSVLEEFGLRASHEGVDQDLFDIDRWYFRDGGRFELLEDQAGALVGCYGLHPLPTQTNRADSVGQRGCELRKMYFDASIRGRGLGRKLVDRAIDIANRSGFAWIELETASCLNSAIALYKLSGFQVVTDAELSERCDMRMIRRLDC